MLTGLETVCEVMAVAERARERMTPAVIAGCEARAALAMDRIMARSLFTDPCQRERARADAYPIVLAAVIAAESLMTLASIIAAKNEVPE